MRIYLFGGAETPLGEVAPLLKLIESVIHQAPVQQVLHIPFARTIATEVEWSGDWFHRYIQLPDGMEYLNAANPEDVARAQTPLVFINGGGDNRNAYEKIINDPVLFQLVQNANYLIGESAGSKILGTYFREKGSDPNSPMVPGLNIVADTVIEPHYSQRNRQQLLLDDMQETGVRYGIGIDTVTAIGFERQEFPQTYEKIGQGIVEIKDSFMAKKA